VAFRGKFKELREMVRKIEALKGQSFRDGLAKRCGAAALKLVADGFRGERDPYGESWKPIKREGKILRDTGRMAAGFSTSPTATGFSINNRVRYVMVHQRGGHVKPSVRVQFADPKTSRFISRKKASRRKLVAERVLNFAQGMTIPKRQMLPEKATGGVGKAWGDALNREAREYMRERLGRKGR
jgi:phage gpG-like protein